MGVAARGKARTGPAGPLGGPVLRLRLGVGLVVLLLLTAIWFYTEVESQRAGRQWTVIDAAYMAMLALTTVGFGEVYPLSQLGRAFTTVYVVTSILAVSLVVRSAAELLVGEQVLQVWQERRARRLLTKMRDHYILCGYGRMGKEVVRQLRRHRVPFVVIEEDSRVTSELSQEEIPYVVGNATHDDCLLEAGVQRAKGLVTALDTDEENMFIALSARVMNPSIYIVARVNSDAALEKLRRAGADRVFSPYVVGGRQMASAVVQPGVTDFLELLLHSEAIELELGSIMLAAGSRCQGNRVAEAGLNREGGAVLLAVQRRDGTFLTNPGAQTRLEVGDVLIAMGTREQLAELERLARGEDGE